jgi:hypothetical protein
MMNPFDDGVTRWTLARHGSGVPIVAVIRKRMVAGRHRDVCLVPHRNGSPVARGSLVVSYFGQG